MSKVKSFLLGTLFGCFVLTGVAFAHDQLQLTVNVSDISYWFDGQPLTEVIDELGNELPPALEYRGMLYAPLPILAEASGRKWEWDDQEQSVHFTSPIVVEFIELSVEEAPLPIKNWAKAELEKQTAKSRTLDGATYVLITRGQKYTGGYDVSVEHIEQYDGQLKVYADWIDPQKGDLVTQGFTYPYALVKIDGEYTDVDYLHRNKSNNQPE